MKNCRTGGLAAMVVAGMMAAGGCSMAPPKVVYPDGSSTVPANNPQRIAEIQTARERSRAMVTENELLRAQIAAMQKQLDDIRAAVATVLLQREKAQKAAPSPYEAMPQAFPRPSPLGALNVLPLPRHVALNGRPGSNAKYYVHTFATDETRFTLDAAGIGHMVRLANDALAIQVQGATDSYVADPPNQHVAYLRAHNARQMLIDAGIAATKIQTRVFPAGYFAVPNDTPYGRSQNRRVEIIFFGQEANPLHTGV